jgi:hypothetical protein
VKSTPRRRGRPPGRDKQINPILPPDAHAAIALLARRKRFGKNPNEIARYLIIRAIEVLTAEGLLPAEPIDPDQK